MRFSKSSCIAVLALVMVSGTAYAQCHGQNTQSSGGGQLVGALIGAALGGLLGSQIGSGDGTKVAIGAGVVAGGFLGNRVAASMDCNDQRYHQATAQSALETQAAGSTSTWTNPESGRVGTVTPVRTYQRADGSYCRDYEQTIESGGRIELANGTACRGADGTWRVVNE
ncbi:MAG: glycine zipper 2TM domain-containing protein [Gammaproteobacteria bacterium]|nr:glycine zipper 2TM domain-containing protein [Gammaproteobacteria bacterium]